MNNTTFVVLTIGLLSILTSPLVMTEANASTQGNSSNPGQVEPGPAYIIFDAVNHINKGQEALQNGDTEGANNHLELAKESLKHFHFGPGPSDQAKQGLQIWKIPHVDSLQGNQSKSGQ